MRIRLRQFFYLYRLLVQRARKQQKRRGKLHILAFADNSSS